MVSRLPDGTDVQELVVLLAKLLDTAQPLSPGPERTAALEQIISAEDERPRQFISEWQKGAAAPIGI